MESRPTWRCPKCGLNQFYSPRCRRCKKIFLDAVSMAALPVEEERKPGPYNLGIRIREIRKMRGLTQRELSAKMNCPRSYISKLEGSRSTPTIKQIERIANALTVPVASLIEVDEILAWGQIAFLGMKENARIGLLTWCENQLARKMIS